MPTNLPTMPEFATPHITCGSDPEPSMLHNARRYVKPQAEHCGGCGWTHDHVEYEHTGMHETARDALRALGRRSGHVGAIYMRDTQSYVYVCAGSCCRDARETATWIAARNGMEPLVHTEWQVDQTDEEAELAASTEAYGEMMYASSYGLGL
jgi:hypothetical protein